MKILGETFKLQKEILKTEKNHDGIDENNYEIKNSEWLDFVKNDVSCTGLSYADYNKATKEITGCSMKDCLSLPRLGWKYFISLKREEDEPIFTYNDKNMRT